MATKAKDYLIFAAPWSLNGRHAMGYVLWYVGMYQSQIDHLYKKSLSVELISKVKSRAYMERWHFANRISRDKFGRRAVYFTEMIAALSHFLKEIKEFEVAAYYQQPYTKSLSEWRKHLKQRAAVQKEEELEQLEFNF